MAMDEREVRSRVDALQKALAQRESSAVVINIMKDLQKGIKPSEELLRKTQVGKIVNKIKGLQSVDPAIPQLASEIVSQWRNQIKRTSGAGTPIQTSAQNGSASPAPQSKPAPTPTSDPKDKPPTGVPLDKRSMKTDGIKKGDITSEPARNNSIGLLYDGLVPTSAEPPGKVLSIAKAIESAVISSAESDGSHTSTFYKDKIRALYQNLRNKDNPELRTRILEGDISPERFAVMTHDELKGDKQKAEDKRIEKENLNNAMVAKDIKSISSHLECGRCKQKKVSFSQAQTRSADEPMTTFCECSVCGHRWKFS